MKRFLAPVAGLALLGACATTPSQIEAWNTFIELTVEDAKREYGTDWAINMDRDVRFSALLICNLLAAASTTQEEWPPEATLAAITACQTIRDVTAPDTLRDFAPTLEAMPEQ